MGIVAMILALIGGVLIGIVSGAIQVMKKENDENITSCFFDAFIKFGSASAAIIFIIVLYLNSKG